MHWGFFPKNFYQQDNKIISSIDFTFFVSDMEKEITTSLKYLQVNHHNHFT